MDDGFTLRCADATMVATFVTPKDVKIEAPGVENIQVEGEGLDATVTVGGQAVRFDGQRVLIGSRHAAAATGR